MKDVMTQHPHWSYSVAKDLLKRFSTHAVSEVNDAVLELFCQLGEALDNGHTVVRLTDEQQRFFGHHSHALVGMFSQHLDNGLSIWDATKVNKPLIISGDLAYLHRQWYHEATLARKIKSLLTHTQHLTAYDLSQLPSSMHIQQRAAIAAALAHRVTLITGGPGTGKTWTVAQLVLTLLRDNPDLRIALAAPTGKAAQRMQEALNNSLESSGTPEILAVVSKQLDQAKTIHRLLGLGHNTAPRFHADNPLPYDLVIVDEASMLGVALANQLMQAIGHDTKVILLGDADQLAAVDAGAVLADLCASVALKNNHVNLTKSTRFTADSAVGQLAKAVLDNRSDDLKNVITQQVDIQQIQPNHPALYTQLWLPFSAYAKQLKALYAQPLAMQQAGIAELFNLFDSYRILTATHAGRLGDKIINQQVSQHLLTALALTQPAGRAHWFHGRPVMMLSNDYQLKLANGDIGIALLDEMGNYQVHFPSLAKPLAANRLSENGISTAFAMTIHKSQGSEFNKVALVLDAPAQDNVNQLLSRELVYTAVTRAKSSVDIYAEMDTLVYAVQTKASRKTGLTALLV